MDVRQRNHVEQSERRAREQGDAASLRHPSGILKKALRALQVASHLLTDAALDAQPVQIGERLANAVLHLDQVFPASLVAGLELQVAGDDQERAGLHVREALHGITHGTFAGNLRESRHPRRTPAHGTRRTRVPVRRGSRTGCNTRARSRASVRSRCDRFRPPGAARPDTRRPARCHALSRSRASRRRCASSTSIDTLRISTG